MSKTYRKELGHKNHPSKRITAYCEEQAVRRLQEKSVGHRIPTGGHSRVNGIVRANEKRIIKQMIDNSFDDTYDDYVYGVQRFDLY